MSGLPRLTELILEITNACHHRCIHCSTVGGLPMDGELTQGERLRVLREACRLGLTELRLLGGDPLFRLRETVELLTEANHLGVEKALIYTSAVERSFDWLRRLTAIAPMQVSAEASIYSAFPEIHDGLTLKAGSLERLLANSREAVRVGFDLTWNFVWMKPNFSHLESVAALACDIGIKRVRVLRLMLNGRARENREALLLRPELEAQCGEILESLMSRFPGVSLAPSKPLAFLLRKQGYDSDVAPCSAGREQLVVQADGKVLPCIGMKDTPRLELGNVRTESVEEIFQRAHGSDFPQMSLDTGECPAILFRKRPGLVQLEVRRD